MRGVARAVVLLCAAACTRPATPAPAPAAPLHAMTRGTYRNGSGERDFAVYVPSSIAGDAFAGSLVVMLHGCTQDADDAARGTRLNEWAERRGFTVLYPEQPARANAKRCWNWYLPAEMTRGGGEVELLAAMIDSVARARHARPGHVALVGMSAGAAMAASLAIAYPSRYAALVMHSGVPAGAAHDVVSALTLMRSGAVGDPFELARATHAAMGAEARSIPVLAVHGSADAVVSPSNLSTIISQWGVVNALASNALPRSPVTLPAPVRVPSTPDYAWRGLRVMDAKGGTSVEAWIVDGLGHAWSGGAATGTFTAPTAPDATALLVSFLEEVWRRP